MEGDRNYWYWNVKRLAKAFSTVFGFSTLCPDVTRKTFELA
jgi:hypothetical protein